MIKKILIANRGEIALRVIKTCRKLGIKSVGIYADDDASLLHASEADECIGLGRGALRETYLNQDKIIEIAKTYGADAIHPGYGFLSENKEFCEKVTSAGIIFIGPRPDAIELMGDKTSSKIKMEELGVPLIPGYHGSNQEVDHLFSEAKKIGFPVLVKASAGGGGKGMRIVRSEEEFENGLASSKREALNAFGNDDVLIEKYIENPRHIEVQLVSDGQGNHFHFFERECSIQRRYQKVIEESPAPNLDQSVKKEMCKAAVKIAKGINYIGAGTIEYILTPDNEFYFLEMNTRLQVEHPITEMTTGRDLVELQIKAASGEVFPFVQSEIKQTGHAIECRIYAEDPDNDFLPTNGRIQKIESQSKVDYRLDCGYRDLNSISTNYDPMLAKLIVWDEERFSCIDKMHMALGDVLFGGVKTNRDYLSRVLAHPLFLQGKLSTHFLEEQAESLKPKTLSKFEKALCIAGILVANTKEFQNIWDSKFISQEKIFEIFNEKCSIEILKLNRFEIKLRIEDETYHFRTIQWSPDKIVLQNDGVHYDVNLFVFNPSGVKQVITNEDEVLIKEIHKAMGRGNQTQLSEGSLQSPMPGKIFKILLGSGEVVTKGDAVLIVEAMKMEHTIRATKDGTIKEIYFNEGDQVQGGVALCEIE